MRASSVIGIAVASALAGFAPAQTVVTFDKGPEGWSINGFDEPTPTGGNPGARLHWDDFIDNFWVELRNDSNPAFIGDYTARGPVTLSVDVQVNYIRFFGTDVSRDLVLELRDYDNAGKYPWVSVWTVLGNLEGGMDWTTFSATIKDPNSEELPDGWGGTGDENEFGEPRLPANRSFRDVLESVDQIVFTTATPGYFYGFTNFNLSVDNVSVLPVGDCAADFDGDGFVTGIDYDLYVQAFEGGDMSADFDGDGFLTGIDFDLYVLAYEKGC
jgi:hypothetical protein